MKILITGGTGSLGTALVEFWKDKHDLVILSRDIHKQEDLRQRFNLTASNFILGDICNIELVSRTIYDGQFDLLIHAAALKVVHQGEENPEEYLRVNCQGSLTVARAWRWYNKDKPAIYINSDKAVSCSNVYGASKFIGEKIFINHGFSSLRYGNVVSSKGSFIHKFLAAKKSNSKVIVKLPSPTRYYLTLTEAINLILDCIDSIPKYGNGIYVPHSLKSFSIEDVAKELGVEYIYESLDIGEKQHEILLSEDETLGKFTTGQLVKVEHGYGDKPDWSSSKTSKRLSGKEVLRKLGVEK